MSKQSTSTAKKNTVAKKQATKQAPAKAAHPALTGIAKRVRNGRNGKPCAKHILYLQWQKNPASFDAESAIKALPKSVVKKPKLSSVRSWVSNWGRGLDGGGFYPPMATAKTIAAAIKKIG